MTSRKGSCNVFVGDLKAGCEAVPMPFQNRCRHERVNIHSDLKASVADYFPSKTPSDCKGWIDFWSVRERTKSSEKKINGMFGKNRLGSRSHNGSKSSDGKSGKGRADCRKRKRQIQTTAICAIAVQRRQCKVMVFTESLEARQSANKFALCRELCYNRELHIAKVHHSYIRDQPPPEPV